MSEADMLRAEGRAEGRAEHAAAVPMRLLMRKFRVLTDEARDRIRAASMGQLDHSSERVLDATTLDEVFR